MAILRPRTRLIYFRVSEDEFAKYTELCRLAGARSLSDLVRSALEQMQENSEGVGPGGNLLSFRDLIMQVNARLERIAHVLERPEALEQTRATPHEGAIEAWDGSSHG